MDIPLSSRLLPAAQWEPLVGFFPKRRSYLLYSALLISLGLGFLYHPFFFGGALLAILFLAGGLINQRFVLYVALIFGILEIFSVTYHQGATLIAMGFIVHSTYAPLFIAITLMCWLAARLAGVISPVPQTNTLDLPVFIMCFSSLVSLLWTPHLWDGAKIVFYSIESVFWFFLFTRLIRTTDHVEFHFRFFLTMAFIITTSAILAFFWSYTIGNDYTIEIMRGHFLRLNQVLIPQYTGNRGEIGGLGKTAKMFAPFLIVAIPLAVGVLCTQTKVLWRRFFQVWVLIMLTLLFLTLSRVDLAGLGLGWLGFAYLNPHWKKKFFRCQLYMVIYAVTAYILAFSLLYNFYSTEEFSSRLGFGGAIYSTKGGTSLQGRTHRFMLLVEHMMATGGLGAGVGGIMRSIDYTYKIDTGGSFNGIGFEHGYGLLSYLVFTWIFANVAIEMRHAHRRWQYERYGYYLRALIWALIAMVTAALLDYVFYSPRFFILIGASIAAARAVQFKGNNLKSNNVL
jgi:hypothetical protein